jgi:hypothetical protein
MLKQFAQKWSSVDHIVPVNRGGGNEYENLATACVECNILKNDKPSGSSLEIRAIPEEIRNLAWDGFALLYPKLTNTPDRWTRALSIVYGCDKLERPVTMPNDPL